MQISILQGSGTGSSVYTETQTTTTNADGLVSVSIGTGTTKNVFSKINWANGPYYLQVEIDPTGGTSYTITGTSEILSVPYALYSNKSDTATNAVYTDTANVSKIPTSYYVNSLNGSVGYQIAGSSTSIGTYTELLYLDNVPAGTYAIYFSCPILNTSTSANGVLIERAVLMQSVTTSDFPSWFPKPTLPGNFSPVPEEFSRGNLFSCG
jgi:hypothetical protein